LQDIANRLFSVEIMGFELHPTIWQRRDPNSLLYGQHFAMRMTMLGLFQ
jgi:hypothetical protein